MTKENDTKNNKTTTSTLSKRFNLELPEIHKTDEKMLAATIKSFDLLTDEDINLLNKFTARVTQAERTTGYGAAAKKEKYWLLEIKVADGVILSRSLSDLEVNLIKAYNQDLIIYPNSIDKRPKVKLISKCMTFIKPDGKRTYKVICEVCPKVFWGTKVKQKNNNGFLSDQQVEQLKIVQKTYNAGVSKDSSPIFVETTITAAEEFNSKLDEFYNQD